MASCKQIITRALRRLGSVYASNEDVTAADMFVGVEALKEILHNTRIYGSTSLLSDVIKTTDYDANPDERITLNSSTSINVALPDVQIDGTPIKGGSMIEIKELNTGSVANYIYISDSSSWVLLDNLTENHEFPMGESLESAFIAMLAVRLSDEFGVQPSQVLLDDYRLAKNKISTFKFRNINATMDDGLNWRQWAMS